MCPTYRRVPRPSLCSRHLYITHGVACPPSPPPSPLSQIHSYPRHGMTSGQVYPALGRHVADFLAQTLFHSSLIKLGADVFRWAAGLRGY